MGVNVDLYTGLPAALKEAGYQTLFFLTSNPQYDNMNAFLLSNHIDKIYSEYNYPEDKIVNNFGVQDDFLFQYGIEALDTLSRKEEPFLATFLTVSNHPPYIVPKEFEDIGDTDKKRMIAFADNSMKQFMDAAKEEEWFNNTIFLFLGDHGRVLGAQHYDLALTHNHVPLIIYSPLFDDMPKRFCQYGGQIDVFPTVMSLLNRSYENSTMGVNLFEGKRPYMYFVSDHHLGCIDDKFFYIYQPSAKTDGLYDYRSKNTNNLKEEYKQIADSMKAYGVSMMLASDFLVKEKLTR